MNAFNPPRDDAGRYTEYKLAEVDLPLSRATNPAYLDAIEGDIERLNALATQGYTPARALKSVTDARNRRGIDEWWVQASLSGEYGGSDHTPKLRMQSSPSMGKGLAPDGRRRTHRRKYEVDGWSLRLGGSKTAILRDMDHYGSNTLDVSVEATDEEGRSARMVMRVTRGQDGLWAVTPVGNPARGDMVAAGVQAMLESRRPTMVPRHVGGLAARARENMSSQGVTGQQNLVSTWMSSANYLDSDGVMTMKTSTGKVYGYSVPREVAENVMHSTKPGVIFNAMVKGKSTVVAMNECGKCGNIHVAARTHRCPIKDAPRVKREPESNRMHRAVAAMAAAGAVKRRPKK